MKTMPGKNPVRGGGGSGSAWNLQEIRELIDLLIEREINEFEMEKGGVRIRIKRGNAQAEISGPGGYSATVPTLWPSPPPPVHPVASPSPSATDDTEGAESTEELHIIKSPIVGTYYASPSPSAPPFVKPGDVVEVGQALCIIEAMKLMNEIESEVAGEVVRIYVENGQPVEYGQSLFAINPSHKK
jgi:acetyl-CoA carboxylase biotin carboxyl carrier protein